MRTIAIVNQKGGCGKTTTAIQLAAEFAKTGQRVLLVDLDAQSHCSAGLRIPDSRVHNGLARMLASDTPPDIPWEDLPIKVQDGLDVLPASRELAEIERIPLDQLTGEETVRLLRVLRSFTGDYDVRILDCPPNLHLLTLNAFRAATE
ncbi:MAG: AAA family ATPase, partial [Phycisphaerales bacterium]|nr:AAA family ATPase [Phycisphaerales bacterium]